MKCSYMVEADRRQKRIRRRYNGAVASQVKPMPFATRAELVRIYDPFRHTSGRATLAKLREAKVVSAGISRTPRGARGRVRGTLHLYSGLNRHAVRLYRRGHLEEATEVALAAAAAESEPEFRELVERISRYSTSIGDIKWGDLAQLLSHSDLAAAMQQASTAMLAIQGNLNTVTATASMISGIVQNVESTLAIIDTLNGKFTIPVVQLSGLGLDQPGAALELAWEMVDASESVVSAALAIPEDSAELMPSPFAEGPILLRPRSADQYKTSLSRAVKDRPPLPIPLPPR